MLVTFALFSQGPFICTFDLEYSIVLMLNLIRGQYTFDMRIKKAFSLICSNMLFWLKH